MLADGDAENTSKYFEENRIYKVFSFSIMYVDWKIIHFTKQGGKCYYYVILITALDNFNMGSFVIGLHFQGFINERFKTFEGSDARRV